MQARGTHTILAPALALFMSCSASAQNFPVIVGPASAPSTITAARGTPQRRAAEQALRNLAHRLRANANEAGVKRVMAVDNYSELTDATLGDAFEINLVDPAALLAGKPIDECIRGTGQWRFLVFTHSKPVGIVTIARIGGDWKMVEAGASELAGEIAAVEAQYSAGTPRPQLRFIRSLQAVADFIEVTLPPVAGEPVQRRYVLLMSARAALNGERGGADTASAASAPALSELEFAERLSARVRRGMQDPRFLH